MKRASKIFDSNGKPKDEVIEAFIRRIKDISTDKLSAMLVVLNRSGDNTEAEKRLLVAAKNELETRQVHWNSPPPVKNTRNTPK